MNDKVTLKEYILTIIKDFKEEFLTYVKTTSEALKLQSLETERRLGVLNGEAERIKQILEKTIPREVYEAGVKELRGLIDALVLANKDNVTKESLSNILKTPTEEIRSLTSNNDVYTGRASQKSVDDAKGRADIGLILAVIAGLIAIANFIVVLIKLSK